MVKWEIRQQKNMFGNKPYIIDSKTTEIMCVIGSGEMATAELIVKAVNNYKQEG